MSVFLSIPFSNYEPLRSALDVQLGYPNDFAPTSLIPNLKASQDGNCYTSVPDSWPTELFSQYVVDEATWRSFKPFKLKTKSVDNSSTNVNTPAA